MLDLFVIKRPPSITPDKPSDQASLVTMSFLLTPSTTINYNFVSGVYGAFAALSVLLFVLQRYTPAVEGFYMVVAPFIPCFFWSLLVRQRWLQGRQLAGDDAAKTETKKDQ